MPNKRRTTTLLAALAAGLALVVAPQAGAATQYGDPAGDSGSGPDITGVSVSNAANGMINFQIAIPGQPQLAPDSKVVLLLDTDRNPATGFADAGGIDYLFVVDGATQSYGLLRWNGTDFEDAPAPTATVSYQSGVFLSINRSDLGNTAGFNFWARAFQGDTPTPGALDDAPDGGLWTYLLSTGQSGAYTDATGDSGTAPDVTSVSVSNTYTGQLGFQIGFASAANLPGDSSLALLLDTDQNPATGDVNALGAEYALVLDGPTQTYGFFRWNGTGYEAAPATTVSVSQANGIYISVNRSELGGATGVNFHIRTIQGTNPAPGLIDDAPDVGTWNYLLAVAPSAAPAAPLTLSVSRTFTQPASPFPGGLFTVFAEVARSDTGEDVLNGTVSCKGRVAGKPVQVVSATFLKGTPECAFRIPAGTSGKRLTGTIEVDSAGATVKKAFSFRIAKRKARGLQSTRSTADASRTLRGHPLGAMSVRTASVPAWLPLG
jgi:hypothetical protein